MAALSAKDRLILPLDVNTLDEALALVRDLKDHVGLFKIGLTLFVSTGPEIVRAVTRELGDHRVFFDLKFLDIPETVGGVSAALRPAIGNAAKFVTVHASQGEGIIRASVEALDKSGGGAKVVGITVLTSVGEEDLPALGFRESTVKERVLSLARIAKQGGAAGVVCSGHEVADIRRTFGRDFIVITPGIRPAGGVVAKDDQRRVMTPREAIAAGSDYIVVGRPIYQSKDRRAAADDVVSGIAEGLRERGE